VICGIVVFRERGIALRVGSVLEEGALKEL
jgi:hypothetical protein